MGTTMAQWALHISEWSVTMKMGHEQITMWKGGTTKWGCCTHKTLHSQKEKRLKTGVDETVVDETGVDKLGINHPANTSADHFQCVILKVIRTGLACETSGMGGVTKLL